MRELAVDVGTSNTVAAVRSGGAVRLLTIDGRPVLPSAVWLGPDGTPVAGREASRRARLAPARYEPTPKRRIDEGEVLLGDTVVPVVELIAAVLRRAAGEATRARTALRCTYPAAGTEPYYATFVSSDSTRTCDEMLTTLITGATRNSAGNRSGAGAFGTWTDVELFRGDTSAATFWRTGTGTVCGVAEPRPGTTVSADAVHAFWDAVIRPGS